MAQVSQVQLSKPVLSILWAGQLLGEHIGRQTIAGGVAVVGCALLAVRARNRGGRTGDSAVATDEGEGYPVPEVSR